MEIKGGTMDKKNIFWIGGSPCCGKSTISEMLIKEFGFEYYKCDDHLDRFMKLGVEEGNELMTSVSKKSKDEIWLRDVDEQVEEEFDFYRYALKVIEEDIKKGYEGRKVVVEGAALLPEFMERNNVSADRYLCMTPTKEFQLDKYSQREWVKGYLSDCTKPEEAFENWMKRDIEYAKIVKKEAEKLNYRTIEIDGERDVERIYQEVKAVFGL